METSAYTPPPVPDWLAGTAPDHQIEFRKSNGETHWKSNQGPQTWTLLCPYDEILIGGRRGGSKSSALIAWFAMGDPELPPDDPAQVSYLNEPSFRGLILRDEYAGMAEFVDEARSFFHPFGCKTTGGDSKPVIFEFKSGAKIYTNHLGNKDAFEKYRGWGLTKIGVEELTQIAEERWYLKLFGSLRNKRQFRVHNRKTFPALRTQIMSTTNPDGCGHVWVKNRFVKIYNSQGNLIPWNRAMLDPISRLTRVFIPMRREDNPYLRDNRQYEGMLLAQDAVTRKQWMEGDWDAGAGLFFEEYRPDGPVTAEEKEKYPWARHKIDPVPLQPWWYRWLGADWGFDHFASFHKFCRNENDKRIHVYDELLVRQVGSFELGVMLANWCLSDLEGLPDKTLTMYLSPDAFSKGDATKTKAEQIEMGIKEVLGPYGAFLLKYNDDERAAMLRDQKAAVLMFERRKAEMARGQMCIAIKPANNDRTAGWSYMHELLRFRPILRETQEEIKTRLEAAFARAGVEAYEREVAQYRKSNQPEVLPRLQIWKNCKQLDRCLKSAMHDDEPRTEDVKKFNAQDGKGGDDPLDSTRYGCHAFKEIQTTVPKGYWMGEKMARIQEEAEAAYGHPVTDINRLLQIQRRQSALYDKQHIVSGGSITLPRAASMRHRVS